MLIRDFAMGAMAIMTFLTLLACVCDVASGTMSAIDRSTLKEEAREMFFHAYHAYMRHAYPADELMPLSCRGRFRDTEPNRGDIDDALGNFSLTLVDTLDTLVVMGDVHEFEKAVGLVVRDVSFDHDIVVSVFETNIRMLGGLLSGHLLAGYLQEKIGILPWYKGELLTLARDLGFRLLPAFNTSTGVPHPRINLRHGMKSPKLATSRETCTACAGTMILELAALSRLTGETIFEEKAHKAMDYLWRLRHRTSDLMGTVLNIHNGDWVRRDSGVGAGIDSYYEYLLKAYILLGDYTYLDRFNTHYSAVMKYISQGPMLVDVHMHRPHTNSRNFMDALLAFWPGLQVLKGDIKPAIETHEMLYQVMQRHNFLPEAFTTDFQVHWGQHPLRPEFLESTYFLHRATGDPYYLEVGRSVLTSLQKHARVPCGFAAVKDVRTGSHEDRMDSFVLAETFKYLYLLFAEREDLLIDMDDFLFTTEAHLFPLTLARLSNATVVPQPPGMPIEEDSGEDRDRTCPNTNYLFPGNKDFAHSIRSSLKNLVEGVCPKHRVSQRHLRANDFQAGNEDHLRLLKKMGISIMALPDGRVQLLHTTTHADSPEDAEEGLVFMQEMIELSETQSKQLTQQPRTLTFTVSGKDGAEKKVVINAGPAQFGPEGTSHTEVTGEVVTAVPAKCCSELLNAASVRGKVVMMERGDCMFVDKARRIQNAGAIAGIVIDNVAGSSSASSPMFAMSGDGKNDVVIPIVFLFSEDAMLLTGALEENPQLRLTISDVPEAAVDEPATKPMDIVEVTSSEQQIQSSDVITYRDSGVGSRDGEVTYVKMEGGKSQSTNTDELRRNIVELRLDSLSQTTFPGSATPVDISQATVNAGSELLGQRQRSSKTDVDSIMTLLNREKEYVLTLQKLIETALGDKKDIDGNTKVLLDRLSEFMRPKELSPESRLQLRPPEPVEETQEQSSAEEVPKVHDVASSPSTLQTLSLNLSETSPEDGNMPRDEL